MCPVFHRLVRYRFTVVFQTHYVCFYGKQTFSNNLHQSTAKHSLIKTITDHWFSSQVGDCIRRRLVHNRQCRAHRGGNDHRRLVWSKTMLHSDSRGCHQEPRPRRPCRRSLSSGSHDSLPLESQSIQESNQNDTCSSLVPWWYLYLVYGTQRRVPLGHVTVPMYDLIHQSRIRHHRYNFCFHQQSPQVLDPLEDIGSYFHRLFVYARIHQHIRHTGHESRCQIYK